SAWSASLLQCALEVAIFCIGARLFFFFFSSRRRHTRSKRDWSSDVCYSDLLCTSVTEGRRVLMAYSIAFATRRCVPNRDIGLMRSEERRVGKECRYGWGRWP